MRVYVSQYGYWWSFSLPEWITFCREAYANGGAYALPESRALKRKPAALRAMRLDPSGDGMPSRPDYIVRGEHRVAYPLDWDLENWLEELAEVGVYVCPDCVGRDGLSDLVRDGEPMDTDWYGTLQYFRCPTCPTRFVSQNECAAEEAA